MLDSHIIFNKEILNSKFFVFATSNLELTLKANIVLCGFEELHNGKTNIFFLIQKQFQKDMGASLVVIFFNPCLDEAQDRKSGVPSEDRIH